MKKILALVLLLASAITLTAQSPKKELDDDAKFFFEFSRLMQESQNRLVLMNKKNNMAKLGEEEIKGKIKGTLHYKTKVEGLSCTVTITYTDFQDEDGWVLNGQIITKANAKANGKLGGVMTAVGENGGKIYYDNVKLENGIAGAGTYGLERDGFSRIEFDPKLYF